MKTKLDELLSNYLRKDKKASASLITKAEISENIYETSAPLETISYAEGNEFISRNIKLWNLSSAKEKSVPGRKEEITFPEFLEFALKTNNKQKDKQEDPIETTTSRPAKSRKQKADELSENPQKEHAEGNSPLPGAESLPAISSENNAKVKQEWVWVTKGKAERKKAILRILALYKQISLLDLCRTHASEIGIIWPNLDKWEEKPWKAVRGDCLELSKENKIAFFKDDNRKIQVKLIRNNNALSDDFQQSEVMPQISADALSAGSIDLNKLRKSLSALGQQLDQLSNEIIVIWKTIITLTRY